MTSLALLIIRATVGGLLAGHGAQKLFGAFGGSGLKGTAGWLESMNLRPGRHWALLAGWSEFGGGLLTTLGALNPLGPIASLGAMLMATFKVHRGKPVWVTAGGAELPIINMAVQTGLMLSGPGRLSVDGLLGLRISRWFGFTAVVAMITAVALGVRTSETDVEAGADDTEQEAGQELQGEDATSLEPENWSVEDPAPAGRPDIAAYTPGDRPGIESWGSPDGEQPSQEDPAIAAINREVP